MAAFAQFSSDLDASTQRLLARGERLTEILKQGQFQPCPVEEQVISIFAGVNGFLDGIDAKEVVRYEASMLDDIRANGSEILDSIRDTKDLTSETEEKLRAFLDKFTKAFA